MPGSRYDVAQVCKNGHKITEYLGSHPEYGRKFCDDCGAPTISSCVNCDSPIRGFHHIDGVFVFSQFEPPQFCGECGTPFPWAATAIEELHAIAQMVDSLSDDDRGRLDSAIDDLVKDSPRTARAALTMKTLAPKVGAEAWGAMRAILVAVATETAKKGMGL